MVLPYSSDSQITGRTSASETPSALPRQKAKATA